MDTAPEQSTSSAGPVLRLAKITKTFPGLLANDSIDFDLRRGEVHALLGENGAGKSTLMHVVAGIYQPDSGQIVFDGAVVSFRSPAQAISAGIGMVHQHFKLIRAFTVAENIHLGWNETPPRISPKVLRTRTKSLADKFNLDVSPDARVEQLSAGEQQRVEILRVLSRGARVLILDEPTAVLTPAEARHLFRALRNFAAAGNSVVFISHKLDEVLEISDRITVLRAGRKITTKPAVDCTPEILATLMVGMEIKTPEKPFAIGSGQTKEVLELTNVSCLAEDGRLALREISLKLYEGEILGVAGVAGNGQRELSEVLTGIRPISKGQLRVAGRSVTNSNPAAFAAAGIGHIPEDRLRSALAPSLSVVDNAVMREYARAPISFGPMLFPSAAARVAREIVKDADVIVPNERMSVRKLSGGNQQRLVARREMRIASRALIAAYPTRGLDIGAANTVLRYLIAMRNAGVAVLVISEELEEMLTIVDRLIVLFKGRVIGEFAAGDVDLQRIGLLMGGKSDQSPALRSEGRP
jgi:general nucleoside transport system ATP-binding protein